MARKIAPVLFAASAVAALAGAAKKPHVLLILADDYGWANFGAHRKDAGASKQAIGETATPNMDSLISEGVLLDRHYAYKICSPSRSSLQSGRLAVHVNNVNTGVTVANVSDPVSGYGGIPRNMTGMAQKLRQAGYRTHMVGKWDAGMATPEHTPWGRGYDTWVGYYQHANDYWRKTSTITATAEFDICLNSFADLSMHNSTYRGGVRDGVSASPACLDNPEAHAACYEEQLFKDRALAVIREHDTSKADSPLFLFYAFHLLHSPLQVPEAYLQKIDDRAVAMGGKKIDTQNRRLYAAMTLWMDEAIGEVIAALKSKGMWDDTLVVFTADNGGPLYEPGAANNHPLKGGKFADLEGGVRVNTFVSGGFVPKEKRGTRFSGVVSIADWYGTFCELAGVDATDTAAEEANAWLKPRGLPLLPPVDSVPQWGFILNGTNARPQLHLSEQAVLEWPHKLIVGKQPYARWTGELFPNCSTVESITNGPAALHVKVFDNYVYLGEDDETQDRITWTDDCADGCLFNVEADPTEHMDLAKDPKYADMLSKLQGTLRSLNKDLFTPGRGVPLVGACDAAMANGGYYGPYLSAENWHTEVPESPGQRQKDKFLHGAIQALNHQIIEKGAVYAAQAVAPRIRKQWLSSMDKCFESGKPEAERALIV